MKIDNIDVLVIGRSCLDHIAVIDQFPEENQKLPLEYRLTEAGGQGGTAACCISRLGGNVAYTGKLGDDPEGRYCLKRLADFGVATEFIEIVRGGITPVAYIWVTIASGHRTIIYERSSLPRIRLDETLMSLAARSPIILLDPEVTYLGRALKAGTLGRNVIVYDCERWREGIEDTMAAVDYFIPTAEFLESERLNLGDTTFSRKIIKLNQMVAGQLIVTRGDRGAYYPCGDKLYRVPAPAVKAVDTIGAGDNFHAAFALAISRGWDLHRSVKLAVAVASLSCEDYGGRNGVPEMEKARQVADRLDARPIES